MQAYQCYLGVPGKVYVALNSSQSYFNKEAVLISDSCNTKKNVCNMGITQNVNAPQVGAHSSFSGLNSSTFPHLPTGL